MHPMNIKRLPRLSGKPYGIVFEFGLLDFLIAYVIREMYNYTVDTSDTQMQIGTKSINRATREKSGKANPI